MSFGSPTAGRGIAKMIMKSFENPVPEIVRWQQSTRSWRDNSPTAGRRAPSDDPFTYKTFSQFQNHSKWEGGAGNVSGYDPRPQSESDWRELTTDSRYTRYNRVTKRHNDRHKVRAGMRMLSHDEQKEKDMNTPRHDFTKPLALMQKQRQMYNDRLDGILQTGTTTAARDKFLRPNPIRRTIHDNSAASAKNRMAAMKLFRSLSPDATLRVALSAATAGLPPQAAAAAAAAASLPDRITFDELLTLLHPPSEYYRLGADEVPADARVTMSSAYPTGLAHTGSVTAYASGQLATGS